MVGLCFLLIGRISFSSSPYPTIIKYFSLTSRHHTIQCRLLPPSKWVFAYWMQPAGQSGRWLQGGLWLLLIFEFISIWRIMFRLNRSPQNAWNNRREQCSDSSSASLSCSKPPVCRFHCVIYQPAHLRVCEKSVD